MTRQRLILVVSLAALLFIVLGAWYAVSSRQLTLSYAGFRYFQLDGRWYVDLQVRNRSTRTIHCDGYVAEYSGGVKTNESMLDFRCTVEAPSGQTQSWPLWFATYLDLKSGETAKLSLNIDPNNPPRHIGLRYSEVFTPPGRVETFINQLRYYAHRLLRVRVRRRVLNPAKVVWCPATPQFNPAMATTTQSKSPP
jgi:outer membrane receptor protein involved in Fe transport